MNIEAMKQALAALQEITGVRLTFRQSEAITALRQAIEEAENQEPDLPPVEIGVDVTEHGTTVMAFYRRPNAVMEMFYSQFHPQPKQPKNPPIHIQNHTHTEQTGRCTSCGGALPVTGRLDRTGECDCIEPLENPIANQPETSGSPMPVACKHKRYSNDVTEDIANCYDCGAEGRMRFVANDTSPQQAEKQEPVCDKDPYLCWSVRCQLGKVCKNTSPPRKPWVGLTDEEFKFIASKYLLTTEVGLEYFQEEIEQRLKERNT